MSVCRALGVVALFAWLWPAGAAAQADAPASSPTTQPARARGEGAKEDGPRGEPSRLWLALDELSFELGFEAEWGRREVRSGRRGPYAQTYRQTNRERRFQETLGLDGSGALLDERVFQFDFSGLWGLSQEWYDETRPGRDLRTAPDGDVLEYDLRGVLFPEGRLTTEVTASRLDDRIPRPFLPSLDRRRERYGLELSYHDDVLPMRLRLYDEDEALRSPARRGLDDERREARGLEYEATWRPSDAQQLRLRYEYEDRGEQYSGTRRRYDTVRDYLTLDHQLTFGLDDKSRLETLARFQDERGDLARDTFELAPQLRLQHTEDLATIYKLQYLRDSFDGLRQDLYRGDVGLEYTCDDWRAALNLYGLHQDAERGGDFNEWGGSAMLAYERDTASGRFRGSIGYEHAQTRADDAGRDGLVISESQTLRDPLLAYLTREYVVPTSLLVTSSDRRRVYVAGRDYLVVPLGRYTALRRVPTGRISNNETVLVSYRYRTSEGRESNRDRLDVRLEHKFNTGWTPYYAGTLQWEAIDRQRRLTYVPRDICRQRFGLRYQQSRWSAYGEYEYNDDSVDPYHAGRVGGDVTLMQRAPHEWDARADLSYFDFSGERGLARRDALLLDISTSYRLSLREDLEARFTAAYRYEDDSLFGVTNGVDVSAALEWKIGLFSALFEVEYDLLDLSDSRDGSLAAWIKLKREIPVIAGK